MTSFLAQVKSGASGLGKIEGVLAERGFYPARSSGAQLCGDLRIGLEITRRRFFQAGAVALTGGVVAASSVGISESNDPTLVRIEIPLAGLPDSFDGFTIAQLSDFHYDPYFSVVPIRKGIDIANRLQPDLIVLTGDYVTVPPDADFFHINTKRFAAAIDPCAPLLAQLRAPHGVFAIFGNHDAGADPERISGTLKRHGIPVLRNQSVPLERDGGRIWLAGLDDGIEGKIEVEAALKGVPSGERVVLLLHEPDFADRVAKFPVDLQLSGHSHGGQIWLPLIGAPWLPDYAVKYPRGLYRIGKLILYTNAGLGTIRLPIRLNAPPEVTLITLRTKKVAVG